jgi:hypothetical protein
MTQPQPITEIVGGMVITSFPPGPPPSPAELAQQQIDALEQQYLMPRITREVLIFQAEERALSQGMTIEQLRTKNKGYVGLKALDDQIAALRALL